MNRPTRYAVCGLLAATALPPPVWAQNAAPKDATGQTAPQGTAAAPSRNTTDGGRKPPTDATGQTAPSGTPLAPSRLSAPDAPASPPSTTRP